MATNLYHEDGDSLFRKITSPASGAKSGDPVACGSRFGIALTDQDANGYATVKFSGSAQWPVKGIDGSGSSAVTEGNAIYFTGTDTPPLSKKATGTPAGFAAAGVNGNATATILVDFRN